MADVQGASGVGGDNRPPPKDSREGKDVAEPKPKKKKDKKGGADDWETTMRVVRSQEAVERGGRAAHFRIANHSGSPVAPEGPPQPRPRCSGRAKTQPRLLWSTPPGATAQPRPRRSASTTTPTSARGKKRAREPSAAEQQPVEEQGEAEGTEFEPEKTPHFRKLRQATTAQVWCYRLRKYEHWYLETREIDHTHLCWTLM